MSRDLTGSVEPVGSHGLKQDAISFSAFTPALAGGARVRVGTGTARQRRCPRPLASIACRVQRAAEHPVAFAQCARDAISGSRDAGRTGARRVLHNRVYQLSRDSRSSERFGSAVRRQGQIHLPRYRLAGITTVSRQVQRARRPDHRAARPKRTPHVEHAGVARRTGSHRRVGPVDRAALTRTKTFQVLEGLFSVSDTSARSMIRRQHDERERGCDCQLD